MILTIWKGNRQSNNSSKYRVAILTGVMHKKYFILQRIYNWKIRSRKCFPKKRVWKMVPYHSIYHVQTFAHKSVCRHYSVKWTFCLLKVQRRNLGRLLLNLAKGLSINFLTMPSSNKYSCLLSRKPISQYQQGNQTNYESSPVNIV